MLTDQQQMILAKAFKALADETRLCVIQTLAELRSPVGQQVLVSHLENNGRAVSQQNVSYVLREFVSAGLVASHRVGRNRLYFILPNVVTDCLLFIHNLSPEEIPNAATQANN
jgi:DNA-binding transcriptional ArsR family regulator